MPYSVPRLALFASRDTFLGPNVSGIFKDQRQNRAGELRSSGIAKQAQRYRLHTLCGADYVAPTADIRPWRKG